MSRDNLITLLRNRSIDEGETGGNSLCRDAADALESAMHAIASATTLREVATPEELDMLPVKAIIRDCVGDAWRKHPDRWRCSYGDEPIDVRFGPFEVVFTPSTEATNG